MPWLKARDCNYLPPLRLSLFLYVSDYRNLAVWLMYVMLVWYSIYILVSLRSLSAVYRCYQVALYAATFCFVTFHPGSDYVSTLGFRARLALISNGTPPCNTTTYETGGNEAVIGKCWTITLSTTDRLYTVIYDTTGQMGEPPAQRSRAWITAAEPVLGTYNARYRSTVKRLQKDHFVILWDIYTAYPM